MKKHNTVAENLMTLLEIKPSLVKDKNALLEHYWFVFDEVHTVADIIKATPAETILRSCRKLVSNGFVNRSKRFRKRIKRSSPRSSVSRKENQSLDFSHLA